MKFLLALLLITAPAFAAPDTLCKLPADQGPGSLHGAWDKLPITLVLDSEFYKGDGSEATQLKKAAATWNKIMARKGKVAFVIAKDGTGEEIPAVDDCSQASYTSRVPNAVGVWKITGEGAHKNQRESCMPDADGSMGRILAGSSQTDWTISGRHIQGASVMLNFEQFNRPGKPSLDIESLMVHQLGHVLGLLHSCNGSNGDSVDSTSAPYCTAETPKEYLEAVMFPFLNIGEVRRDLGQNDIDRVNCLY